MGASRGQDENGAVAILFPSGSGQGDWHMSVENGSQALKLTVIWPTPLLDMEVLHAKWLRPGIALSAAFSLRHPKYLAFINTLWAYRSRVTDGIESTARFLLPFLVETI